jgi:hypothetical protein
MTDENRSVEQHETWQLNADTSEPKTLNPEPLNPEPGN